MISLLIKVPAVEFIDGAALQVSFEGNYVSISNQKIGGENCDILFRDEYAIKAQIGWDENGCFFLSDVDFDDALVEIVSSAGSTCLTLEKNAKKTFENIRDKLVSLIIDRDVEIICSQNSDAFQDEALSPLGTEIVTITQQAQPRIIEIKSYKQGKQSSKKVKKSSERAVVEQARESSRHSEKIEQAAQSGSKKSSAKKLVITQERKESQTLIDDVAWWARSGSSWDEDVVAPANEYEEEFVDDDDIDEFEEMPSRADSARALAVEFDDEPHTDKDVIETSVSTELRQCEFEIEYRTIWQQFRTTHIEFRLRKKLMEHQRISVIPQLPGCDVVPDKFLFENNSPDKITFFVTPLRLGRCKDFRFDFMYSASKIGSKKLEHTIKIRLGFMFRAMFCAIIASIFLSGFLLLEVKKFLELSPTAYFVAGFMFFVIALLALLTWRNKLVKEVFKMDENRQ